MASVPAEGADHFFCHAIKVYLFLLGGHLTKIPLLIETFLLQNYSHFGFLLFTYSS